MNSLTKAFLSKVALEAQATEVKAGRETEIVIYARITDFEGLKKAQSKQSQEQWQVNGPFGKIRVRNEAQEGVDGVYTMAIKCKDSMLGGSETEMGIQQEVFDAFKTISNIGMIKDRYIFPTSRTVMRDNSGRHNVQLPELKFEVDVFKKPDGTYHEWCKIDFEIDAILAAVKDINESIDTAELSINISDLPFRPMEMIDNTMKDQATRDKITQLYETVFLTKRNNDQAGVPPEAVGEDPAPVPTQTAEPPAPAPVAPPATEPATPDTGEITGVDNPTPAETAEAPTLEEPAATPPVEEKAPDAPVPDVPAPEETGQATPIPTAKLEEAADKPATTDAPADKSGDDKAPAKDSPEVKDEAPKEESAKEDPPKEAKEPKEPAADTPPADEPPVDAPAADPEVPPEPVEETVPEAAPDVSAQSEIPAEEPVVDPDSVVSAGGEPDDQPDGQPAAPAEGMTEDKVRLLIREEIARGLKEANAQTK